MHTNSIINTINNVIHRQNFAPTLRALTEDEQTFAVANAVDWLSLDCSDSALFSEGRHKFMSNYSTPENLSASKDFLTAILPAYKKVPLSSAFEAYKENNPNCIENITTMSNKPLPLFERIPEFETMSSRLSLMLRELPELQLENIVDFITSFEKMALLMMEPLLISIIGVPLYLATVMLPLHRTGALLKLMESVRFRNKIFKIPAILKNALRRASMMLTNHSNATTAILSITATYLLTTLKLSLNSSSSNSLSFPATLSSLPGPARGPEVVERAVNNVSTGLEIIGGYACRLSTSVMKGYVLNAGQQVQDVVKAAGRDSKS